MNGERVEVPLSDLLESMETGSRPRGGVGGLTDGVPSIGGEHLTARGTFNFTNVRYVPRPFFNNMKRGRIREGDVLVVKDGATTGKVSFVRSDFPFSEAAVNEHVFLCRPKPGVNPEYLFLFLRSKTGQWRVLSHFKGSAQGGITREFAELTFVPFGPPEWQDSVVRFCSAFDGHASEAHSHLGRSNVALMLGESSVIERTIDGRLSEDWRAANSDLSAQLVLERVRKEQREDQGKRYREPRLLPTEELPDIPKGWAWAALPELGELGRGKSKHRPRNDPALYGGPYPFIQTGDVARARGRITSHSQTYNEAGLAQSRLWPARTVCITIAANIAESALLAYPACFPDSVVGLIADERLALPEYVELFIRTARRDLAAFAPATAQANINLAILSEVAVPLPPVEEQHEISRRVSAFEQSSSGVKSHLEVALDGLSAAVDRALADAFFKEQRVYAG